MLPTVSPEMAPAKLASLENLAAEGSWELSQTSWVAHETVPMHDLPEVQSGHAVLADVVRNTVAGLKRNDRAIVGVCGPMGMIKDVTKAVRMWNGVRNGLLVDLYSEELGW